MPPPPDTDASHAADAGIVSRMSLGDATALAALYDRHATQVYSHALHLAACAADAEAITERVFTQAWKSSRRYDPASRTVVAWLVLLTRSHARESLT